METCSNCGASVRPGAKFCTGCGNRLNDVDTGGSGPSGWNELAPVEDASPSNEASEPAVGRVVSTRIVSGESPATIPEPVTDGSAPATTWTWGSLETDDPAARVPVTPVDGSEPASSGADPSQEPATDTSPASEPFQWSWDTPSSGEPADEANATEVDSPPIAEPMADSPPDNVLSYRPSNAPTAEPADSVTSLEAETSDEDQADRNAREAEIADMPPPYDWRQSVSYGYKEKSLSAADVVSDAVIPPVERNGEEPSPSGPAASDNVGDEPTRTVVDGPNDEPGSPAPFESNDPSEVENRVLGLLDELRSLIPALSADSTGSQGQTDPGVGEAVSAAIQELDEAIASVGASSDLRAVLEAARTRPRDMDAVLDLVAHAESLLDLLDERDRLAAAIERAASTLRPTP